MNEFKGKIAFITGAASGIGLGMARACLKEGMRVVMADVRSEALAAAASDLAVQGASVFPHCLDVTDRAAWETTAQWVERDLGPVDLLCSNAGVNFIGATQNATFEDWDFALGVNLGGAINAIRTFAPRMVSAGRGAHIVITSSVSGLFTGGGAGVYATSKYALVGLAESLRADLRSHGVGVSVLCPGPVKSELFESTAAVRPQRLAATGSIPIVPAGVARDTTEIFLTAPSGEEIGDLMIAGVRRNAMYILTHPEIGPVLEARAEALIASLPRGAIDQSRIDASSRLLDTSLYSREHREL